MIEKNVLFEFSRQKSLDQKIQMFEKKEKI